VDRGEGVSVYSVIWFSDICGYTTLSSLLDYDSIIELINDVFEITETVLKKHVGKILKFMGDGVLAVFTDKSDSRSTMLQDRGDPLVHGTSICLRAKKAAEEFQICLKELSDERTQRGWPGTAVGIGLHYGDCSYGNIGALTRLVFTVIGPSVNLASRVEGLCSNLKASVLVTEQFIIRDKDAAAWEFRGGGTF
jgi:adenylate cyclase